MSDNTTIRVAGYCRTSSEGQRDNTSIAGQKAAIEAYCQREKFALTNVYVDESCSGAKVAGRESFQRLMRDAATGKFDLVVVYSVTRWGRDGADIIDSARTLQRDFNIGVVETGGSFDTRKRGNALINFVTAGVSEHERLTILERTARGRMARAREGKLWSGTGPIGRAYDKEKNRWHITDKGHAIATVLQRYADGEALAALCAEYGFPRKNKFSDWVHHGQIAGVYKAPFKIPELDIHEEIVVPGMPELISPELLERVKARLDHNRTYNRTDCRQYPLGGFIFCADCGRALHGHTPAGRLYYRHAENGCPAGWRGVRGEKLTKAVMTTLYRFCVDEPAFNAAVEAAMPSTEQRTALVADLKNAKKQLARTEKEIENLIAAIAQGVDPTLLIARQEALKNDRTRHQERVAALADQLATMPTADQTRTAAMLVRIALMNEHRDKDYRSLPTDDIQRFMHFLFGDNPKKDGTGIFITREPDGTLTADFRGRIEMPDGFAIVDGNPRIIDGDMADYAHALTNGLQRTHAARTAAAKQRRDAARNALTTPATSDDDNAEDQLEPSPASLPRGLFPTPVPPVHNSRHNPKETPPAKAVTPTPEHHKPPSPQACLDPCRGLPARGFLFSS